MDPRAPQPSARALNRRDGLVLLGLMVAIPTLVAWSLFNKRVEALAVELEGLCDALQRRLYAAQDAAAARTAVQQELARAQQALAPECRQALDGWDAMVASYSGDEHVFVVRDKEVRVQNHTTSLSGLRIPKVALPRYRSHGDRLRSGPADARGDTLGTFDVDVGHDDRAAGRGDRLGVRLADPAARAGDDRDGVGEVERDVDRVLLAHCASFLRWAMTFSAAAFMLVASGQPT